MPTEQEIKDWYNKRYASGGINSMRPYEAYLIFLDYLGINGIQKDKKLLDVSCGTGFLLRAASKRGLETYGTDISKEAVKIAQKTSPKSILSVGKGEDLKFNDNTFDYVTCLGSLEHFLDMNMGLFEMKRVAKKNTKFCIMVPNSKFILEQPGTEQQDINENLLSLKQWGDIFIKNGFKILNIYQDRWPIEQIHIFSSANPLGILKRIIYKFFLPLNYTYQFIFILKKR
jgi:ubiquinone/menaquinone biosynthesis C-methylase UbiE